jgi:hypothetical protein
MNFSRASLLISILVLTGCAGTKVRPSLPDWVVGLEPTPNAVICSHEHMDPQKALELAEASCLASAAKLGGVSIKVDSSTADSLTGADSSELIESQALSDSATCIWTRRFLEVQENGRYRQWLECRYERRVGKSLVEPENRTSSPEVDPIFQSTASSMKAIVYLTTIPPADSIRIGGGVLVRVINPFSNPEAIQLRSGDKWIEVRRHRFAPVRLDLGEWDDGQIFSVALMLDQKH